MPKKGERKYPPTCSVEDCGKATFLRGVCYGHYRIALEAEKRAIEGGGSLTINKNGRMARGPGGGGGGPRVVADEATIKRIRDLAGLQCTILEIAGVLQIAENTLHDLFKRSKEAARAFQEGKMNGKASLRRMQFVQAKRSAAMAIWLGKNYLDQIDSKMIVPVQGHSISDEMGTEEGATALLRAVKQEDE